MWETFYYTFLQINFLACIVFFRIFSAAIVSNFLKCLLHLVTFPEFQTKFFIWSAVMSSFLCWFGVILIGLSKTYFSRGNKVLYLTFQEGYRMWETPEKGKRLQCIIVTISLLGNSFENWVITFHFKRSKTSWKWV